MKRICLVVLVCLGFSLNAFSQYVLEHGPVIPLSEGGKITRILGGDATYFYALREDGKGKGQRYYIDQYSLKDFGKGFSTMMDAAENAQNIDVFFDGEKAIMFYCTQENKLKPSSLFVTTVDSKGNSTPSKHLVTANSKKPEKDVYVAPSYYFTITMSPDKKHLAVIVTNFENKGNDLKAELTVYDTKTLSKEWSLDISAQKGRGYVVSNDGSVAWVTYNEASSSDKLMVAEAASKSITEVKLDLSASQALEGVCLLATGNTIVTGGFFKETIPPQKAGTFCQIYDIASKKTLKSGTSYLTEDQMKKVFPDKDAFAGTIIDVDNGRIIGEEFYFIGKDVESGAHSHTHQHQRTSVDYSRPHSSGLGYGTKTTFSSHTSTTQTYETKRNIVFKVNKEGVTEWVKDVVSGSVIGRPPLEMLVSGNAVLRPDVVNFEMDNHLVVIHANAKTIGFSMKASMIGYTKFEKNGEVQSWHLCPDDKNCFQYTSMGIYGYSNVFYAYDKNVIVYFDKKENRHFGRIVFQ